MITELTKEQELKVSEYRERYFRQAICTERADRAMAEEAARRLCDLGGVEVRSIEWVSSPGEGYERYNSLWYSLRRSLRDSPRKTLRDLLRDSLSNSLWYLLSNSLIALLRRSLRDTLSGSLSDTLSGSLRDTLSDLLWDSGWICYYTYCRDILGVVYSEKSSKMLDAYNDLLSSCFGMWILDGTVILCERPTEAKIEDGKLVDMKWGEK